MKKMIKWIAGLLVVILLIIACGENYRKTNKLYSQISELESEKLKLEREKEVCEQSYEELQQEYEKLRQLSQTGYRIFYGKWEFEKVISAHHNEIGSKENTQELIGKQVVYMPEYYSYDGKKVENPNYVIQVYPVVNQEFFDGQTNAYIKSLLPEAENFVFVQIVDTGNRMSYRGREILVKDDNTMYAYENNCVYELKRVAYMPEYDWQYVIRYQER